MILIQYILPKHLLTRCAGRLARWRGGRVTTTMVRAFIRRYGVDMSEAANSDPASYASFNDFFGRALRAGARPMAATALVCPVDGTVSQAGPIHDGRILQAKGHTYSAAELLGGDAARAAPFLGGRFATLYLSPRDYHRIHMPCDGSLVSMTYVPGDLFSVNPETVDAVPGLFARNERVVCMFEGPSGPFALVLVGATIVGSMITTWHGVVNGQRPGGRGYAPQTWHYKQGECVLCKGEEMGRFLLGSTVVLLFPPGAEDDMAFPEGWAKPGRQVRQGEAMSAALPG
ncbi:phosphatidylserine decarboxylase [Pusillimonas sp. TS35]|uniref:archaetidylserine decarboxylase n=1 Tax=Paracandidimonas lactea TaxID=2895524 RepID=UPI00136F33EE|nr:archaetidylserine decarboxylase [Paracandidimonas lactea]MYN14504.1 phosphatidylserine decarboxylase [Pusillimonas sp. TS35]